MFHTPNEVNIKITWQNQALAGLPVSWTPEEAEGGNTYVETGETSTQFPITLPESKLSVSVGNLPPILLEWAVDADGNGHFQLQPISQPWEPRSGKRNEDKFGLATSHVTFSHILSSEGVVIVGILDIGGGGHHQ